MLSSAWAAMATVNKQYNAIKFDFNVYHDPAALFAENERYALIHR